MIIKRIVAISLFSSLAVMGLLLIVGLFVPTGVLEKLSTKKDASQTVVALDKNGQPIQGATVEVKPDGTTAIIDASGNQVSGATASAGNAAAATPGQSASGQSPSSGGSSGSTGGTTTPPPSNGGSGGSTGGTTTPPPTSGGGGTTTPAPTISSFSASPASIAYNASSTLSWASANASSCSMSPGGAVATSGSKGTGALTATTTFTLNCSGNGSASRQTTVSVAAAPPSCGSPGGACTAAQVATHNSQSNCWVIYSGSYYIVTNYVFKHNGGAGAFTSTTCGHDITAYMNGTSNSGTSVAKHNHSSSAYSTLNSYKVGAVN